MFISFQYTSEIFVRFSFSRVLHFHKVGALTRDRLKKRTVKVIVEVEIS